MSTKASSHHGSNKHEVKQKLPTIKSCLLTKTPDEQNEDDEKLNAYLWEIEKEKELQTLLVRKKELDTLQSHTQTLDEMIYKKYSPRVKEQTVENWR